MYMQNYFVKNFKEELKILLRQLKFFDRIWIMSSLNIIFILRKNLLLIYAKIKNKIHHLMDFHRAAVDNQ